MILPKWILLQVHFHQISPKFIPLSTDALYSSLVPAVRAIMQTFISSYKHCSGTNKGLSKLQTQTKAAGRNQRKGGGKCSMNLYWQSNLCETIINASHRT